MATVNISFDAPANDGGSPITSYTVTHTPGDVETPGAASPIAIFGLAAATEYTFTVTATNVVGTSVASAPPVVFTTAA